MTVGLPSAILASIVSLTVAIAILFRRPRRPLYRRFAGLTFSLFLWHGASFIARLGGEAIVRFQLAAALCIAPTAILFFAELLRDHGRTTRRMTTASLAASVLLMFPALSPWGTEFLLRAVVTIYVLGALGWVLHRLSVRARGAREDERKRLLYVLVGGLIALVLAIGELLPGAELPAVLGHVAVTFYVFFLYQSILSRRVIDLVELLGKAAVLGVLTLVLASVYALLVWWVGREHPGLWLFNTLIASFVILILYDQVRPWVEEATAKLLFRQHYELRQVVRRLVRALQTTISIDEMANQVLEALHGSGRASQVAVYLAAEGDLSFELRGQRGEPRPPQVLSLSQQPMLLQELRRDRRPILLEHLVDRYEELPAPLTDADPTIERELERTSEAIATMRDLHANLVLPMLAEERIVGILTLGTEHSEAYATEEIASLLSVADACAIVIENSQEYEKLRERDRLVAVGEVAAGIAHEIRNPLGAIKGAAQCLDPGSLPREAEEFITVIIEEVDRLNGVLSQLLEYARPYRGNPVATNINNVVTATLRLFAGDAVPVNVHIKQELASALPKVQLDPEQLKQVLLNLILNAIQAMPKGGELSVQTSASRARPDELRGLSVSPGHHMVVVRVRDSGEGIKPEDLPRIFMPFFTTKPHGTGLGLAIAHRIVKNAGGHLEVWSRHGQGATFTLRFPASADTADSKARADATPAPPMVH